MVTTWTADEIRAHVELDLRLSDFHGTECDCCERAPNQGMRHNLRSYALYSLDDMIDNNDVLSEGQHRYSDVSKDALKDELMVILADAALEAARRAIAEGLAIKLGGRLARREAAVA